MASHVFHEIFLHLNWHTKDDMPVLTAERETMVHELLRARCKSTKGVYLHAVGGTATHVHLAISIEPQVCISEVVGELKGGSAHDANARERNKLMQWQRGFGVVSFSKKQLPWVLEYIAQQKEHHAKHTTLQPLETADEEKPG